MRRSLMNEDMSPAEVLLAILQLLGFLDDDDEPTDDDGEGEGQKDDDEDEYPSNTQVRYTADNKDGEDGKKA